MLMNFSPAAKAKKDPWWPEDWFLTSQPIKGTRSGRLRRNDPPPPAEPQEASEDDVRLLGA